MYWLLDLKMVGILTLSLLIVQAAAMEDSLDPCGTCGTYAECNVRNHRANCFCPDNFLGDPFTRCYPECTQHEECLATQACFNLKCVDPCTGVCGIGAKCRVESHKAICSKPI